VHIDKLLETSGQVETSDLDWDEAAHYGLTDDERFICTYFSDIETQTIMYMRDLLHLPTALELEVTAFLSMWNYEEHFHGRALAKILEVCGHGFEEGDKRLAKVRQTSAVTEVVEDWVSRFGNLVFRDDFATIPMTWGASQELTTCHGYHSIATNSRNPVLRKLAERIELQERRHFAWYYNTARQRLASSAIARKITRFALKTFWSPVGMGVKTEAEVYRLLSLLFPGAEGMKVAQTVDGTIGELPGLSGISLLVPFCSKATDFMATQPKLEDRRAA
jgi:rubrerythrin